MRTTAGIYPLVLVATVLSACGSVGRQGSGAGGDELGGNAEEIYVFRTARTHHERGATPACAAAPFTSANEDYYELWSIKLRSQDSRLLQAHQSAVGGFKACLGPLTVGQPVPMYASGTLARIPWAGVGECLPLESQPPIRTAIAFTCHLDLNGLPSSYTGGSLVSSTLAPLLGGNQPADAHVPGYLSTSVVTVRLWKKNEGAERRCARPSSASAPAGSPSSRALSVRLVAQDAAVLALIWGRGAQIFLSPSRHLQIHVK